MLRKQSLGPPSGRFRHGEKTLHITTGVWEVSTIDFVVHAQRGDYFGAVALLVLLARVPQRCQPAIAKPACTTYRKINTEPCAVITVL